MVLDQQEAPSPPRRTLTDLPAELKAIIARMAWDQDEAYRARTRGIHRENEMARMGKEDWDGRSANALALVDRGWHSAASPLLFETITSKGCSKTIFGFRIVRKYGRFVKRVEFDGHLSTSWDHWQALLRTLPSFSNLLHIKFSDEASFNLFGFEDGGPDEDQATFREALQSIAMSITSLEIRTTSDDALPILPMFSNLRRCSLDLDRETDDEEGEDDKWEVMVPSIDALRMCTTLEHLEIVGASEALSTRFVEQGVESWAWRSLRSLQMTFTLRIGTDTCAFIRSFAGTLESLSIRMGAGLSDELEVASGSPVPTLPLPHLRRLTINEGWHSNDVAMFVKLFSAPVQHLVLSIYRVQTPTPTLLETALRLSPTHLRSLHLNYRVGHNVYQLHSLAPTLTSIASARNVSLTLTPSYDVFLHRDLLAQSGRLPTEDLDDICDQLGKVLQYGMRHAEGLRVSRDAVAVDKLRVALEPLKAHMMRAEY